MDEYEYHDLGDGWKRKSKIYSNGKRVRSFISPTGKNYHTIAHIKREIYDKELIERILAVHKTLIIVPERKYPHTNVDGIIGKHCGGCGVWKCLDEFHKTPITVDKLTFKCGQCLRHERLARRLDKLELRECNPHLKDLCGKEDCDICFPRSCASDNDMMNVWNHIADQDPLKITKKSLKIISVFCTLCGHHDDRRAIDVEKSNIKCVYCSIPSRVLCSDRECEFCFNRSFMSHRKLEWFDKERNPDTDLRMVTKSSNKKFHLSHPKCGHYLGMMSLNLLDDNDKDHCRYCCKPQQAICDSDNCEHCFSNSLASVQYAVDYLNKEKSEKRLSFPVNLRMIIKGSDSFQLCFDCPDCGEEYRSTPYNLAISNSRCTCRLKFRICICGSGRDENVCPECSPVGHIMNRRMMRVRDTYRKRNLGNPPTSEEVEKFIGLSKESFYQYLLDTFNLRYNKDYETLTEIQKNEGRVELDEIIPIYAWNLPDENKYCWHWANSQLLRRKKNREKGHTFTEEYKTKKIKEVDNHLLRL